MVRHAVIVAVVLSVAVAPAHAQWTVFGENLGKGASAQEIFNLWMKSQTHHDTMTDAQ